MNFKPAKRPAEREAHCRSCDCLISKGTDMVTWYSFRNRGMHIHICVPCATKIGELAKQELQDDSTAK